MLLQADARVAKLATWRPFNHYLRDRGVEAARCRVCLDAKGLGLVAATPLCGIADCSLRASFACHAKSIDAIES